MLTLPPVWRPVGSRYPNGRIDIGLVCEVVGIAEGEEYVLQHPPNQAAGFRQTAVEFANGSEKAGTVM
jgi:hypothetical protein